MRDRAKRSTAGNRMAKLLNEEEECQDEFYKVNYGGFQETATDNEYEAEEEGEDQVDSDFSIDENDEPVSENEEESQRKKRRLVTKAYKEPVPNQNKQKSTPKPKPSASKENNDTQQTSDQGERKSIRKSTAAKSAATAQRVKIRTLEQKKKAKKPKEEEWIPTQEELLEEAKVTELENLQALERYQKMESEKKSRRPFKRTRFGPIIRYHSMRMPLIEEVNPEYVCCVMIFKSKCLIYREKVKNENKADPAQKYYERTFITFLDDPNDVVYKNVMKIRPPPKVPNKLRCTITKKPAKYVDPLTCLPYHDIQSFNLIREAYYQQLEAHGDKNDPVMGKWLEWYAKNKDKSRKLRFHRSVPKTN
ncbi:vacuolar protein sorting-associated protein 72 homolog isoform X2 [Photinus pyralis]|uniref:vacuolar protein sorting-associated protein 72 homolog isoform X2 n=1 Tax=Photinus pyralis TaxID=7054 RepID=UPI0012671A20|nr:vacuolar protein sorting-associated protein 72 homolog isoform X2 [Photinus pyralis]